MINIDYIEAANIVYALHDQIKEEEKRLERVQKLDMDNSYLLSLQVHINDLRSLMNTIRVRVNNALEEEVL